MASFPERTGDAWLAIAVADRFPQAQLWSPTQNVTRNWDLAVNPGGGKVLIFENKGCTSRDKGHSIRIDWPQLLRYLFDPIFTRVKHVVFYVLPSPPWAGDPPHAPVVPPAAAGRTVSPKGVFADWAFVLSASALYAYMNPSGYRSINTRQLPGSPALWPAHQRGPVPGPPPTLRSFLNEVADCKHVERLARNPDAHDRIPAVDENGDPFAWWVQDEHLVRQSSDANEEFDGKGGTSKRDGWPADDLGHRGAPSPVVAFIPNQSLNG